MKHLPIYGFGIGGYRSFSGAPQIIGPFKKVNIFIGETTAENPTFSALSGMCISQSQSEKVAVKSLSGSDVPQGVSKEFRSDNAPHNG